MWGVEPFKTLDISILVTGICYFRASVYVSTCIEVIKPSNEDQNLEHFE